MKIISVNERIIKDIIEWKYALAHPVLNLTVLDENGEQNIRIRHRSGEDIGVVFESPTLDDLKVCKNNCIFCFVKQMPPGQRESLYVKDDDFRLSLIYGSFVTLTNLSEEDFVRIETEKISPIYVSVHTTNPELRVSMMRNPHSATITAQIKRLIAAGIGVHAQLVLVPGVNDGPELLRSLTDLTSLYPGVESVAVVPVGLTGYREGLPELVGFNKDSARTVLDTCYSFSKKMRRRHGQSVVYAADELYILAQADFPGASHYDEFPQLENGVGLSRLFIDSFYQALRSVKKPTKKPTTWITGESSAFILKKLQHELNARSITWVDVLVANNQLFGGRVTVTGLLGGNDIIRTLKSANIAPGTRVLIPDITLRENRFLDNVSFTELQAEFPALSILSTPTTGESLVLNTLVERNEP